MVRIEGTSVQAGSSSTRREERPAREKDEASPPTPLLKGEG